MDGEEGMQGWRGRDAGKERETDARIARKGCMDGEEGMHGWRGRVCMDGEERMHRRGRGAPEDKWTIYGRFKMHNLTVVRPDRRDKYLLLYQVQLQCNGSVPASGSCSRTWWPSSAATAHETEACTHNRHVSCRNFRKAVFRIHIN